MNRQWVRGIVVLGLAGWLMGCGKQPAVPVLPVAEVAVVAVRPEAVELTTELPGRTTAYAVSEVRPQVNGLIQRRLFVEGGEVKEGEVLYQIDPAPFQAAYEQAVANLEAARKAAEQARAGLAASMAEVERQRAILELAQTNRRRVEALVEEKAVSASDLDRAVAEAKAAEAGLQALEAQVARSQAAVASAEAAIRQAEAAVEAARINLGYTQVTAPISGRISRSYVTEGAFVVAYQSVLARIQRLDPIYVDVPRSSREILELRRRLEAGKLRQEANEVARVQIVLEDGRVYGREGTLRFQEVSVNPGTGSVILRVEVPNPEYVLLPGMFVRVRIREGVLEKAILVPQEAVQRDSKGRPYVLVVNAEDKVELRMVELERAVGSRWLVSGGLEEGQRVIVEGLQRVRPGMAVRAVEGGKGSPGGQGGGTAGAGTGH